jgi:hypothetical protein
LPTGVIDQHDRALSALADQAADIGIERAVMRMPRGQPAKHGDLATGVMLDAVAGRRGPRRWRVHCHRAYGPNGLGGMGDRREVWAGRWYCAEIGWLTDGVIEMPGDVTAGWGAYHPLRSTRFLRLPPQRGTVGPAPGVPVPPRSCPRPTHALRGPARFARQCIRSIRSQRLGLRPRSRPPGLPTAYTDTPTAALPSGLARSAPRAPMGR